MSESDGSVRILEELMLELRRLAGQKDVSVSDIVHEALGEFIYARNTGVNYLDVIHSIEESMSKIEHFVVTANLYDFAVSVKSPLRYVHRPALRYHIRITQNRGPHIGEISVALRSRDISILRSFAEFLNIWIRLENKYLQRKLNGQIEYSTDIGCFDRKIYPVMVDRHISGQALGAAVGDYIHAFDDTFKYYFYNPNSGNREIEDIYAGYINNGKLNI